MKRLVFAVAAVLLMSTNSYATNPASNEISIGNYSNPASTAIRTRANLYITFSDSTETQIHQPDQLVSVWVRFKSGANCGAETTIATLTLHNGITVPMKQDLDYHLVVPMTLHDWVLEVDAYITQGNLLGTCLSIGGRDATGNSLTGTVSE